MSEKNEVELKLVVDGPTASSVLCAAGKMGVKQLEQCDEYYSSASEDYMDQKFPYKWLRVREFGDAIQVCFKHFYPEGAEVHEYCEEIELLVDDADGLRQLLRELGFDSIVKVEKRRQSFRYEGDVEVSVDDVKGLGLFVELEYVGGSNDVRVARSVVEEAVKNLGLDGCPVDRRGYPYRLYHAARNVKR